jgi:hypothetical protein
MDTQTIRTAGCSSLDGPTDRATAIAYLLREKPDTTQHPAARRLGLQPVQFITLQCDREFKEIGNRKPSGCLSILCVTVLTVT